MRTRVEHTLKTHAQDVWRDWGADQKKRRGKEKAALGVAFYELKKMMPVPKSATDRSKAKRKHKDLDTMSKRDSECAGSAR